MVPSGIGLATALPSASAERPPPKAGAEAAFAAMMNAGNRPPAVTEEAQVEDEAENPSDEPDDGGDAVDATIAVPVPGERDIPAGAGEADPPDGDGQESESDEVIPIGGPSQDVGSVLWRASADPRLNAGPAPVAEDAAGIMADGVAIGQRLLLGAAGPPIESSPDIDAKGVTTASAANHRIQPATTPGPERRPVGTLRFGDTVYNSGEVELISAGDAEALKVEVSLHLATEPRVDEGAATSAANPPPIRHPPGMAHDVIRQIAAGAEQAESGRIEVTLTPEELGKVRLVITGGERPAVTVYAEHGETLELLRRHSEILARELRGAGLGTADMSFASNAGTGQRQDMPFARSPALAATEPAPAIADAPRARRLRPGSQIDIRI